jgi:phospholipid/cholesterol/gamma-HCH transport system ATP-binding protein
MNPGNAQHKDKQPTVEVRGLTKSFGGRPILRGVDFEVWPGETLGIIGPSGCGKSTILKLLCGLIPKDGGEIHTRTDDIGLVFQAAALLNSLTVRQNLALALRARNIPEEEEEHRITETLSLVGLADKIDAYPSQLSGGQQKRVSFARAVVYQPQIILYDEPTTGLDPVRSTLIEDYMIQLEDKLQAAAIVVTHQYSTWKRAASRIILLNEGKVVWRGTPDEAESSDNPYIRQFVSGSPEGPMGTL